MNFKTLLFSALSIFIGIEGAFAEKHYVGGDISLLPEYELAEAKYYDENGNRISDLLSFCYDKGMNAMRVRLFVNPSDFPANDPNVCQTLEYIMPLCKRIKDEGFALMLDFHYSDTWADPVKQWTPKSWANLSDEELYVKIYDYTKATLAQLKENRASPDFIQTGNEISYGMLWGVSTANSSSLKKCFSNSDDNWPRFVNLLKNAIKACREECPDAKIILHTERVANQQIQQNFYQKMKDNNVDYDIIGLSYYPYFHGKMSVLDTALANLEKTFPDKEIMIVETGYSYAWEVPGTQQAVEYPYSNEGQNSFASDLLSTVGNHKSCIGIFWWWMEYNAFGTSLTGWYNAPLFDSRTGRATKALSTISKFNEDGNSGVEDVEVVEPESDSWFDLTGRPLSSPSVPGFYIHNRKAVYIR